ncbi:MAG: family 78 glycoside hydrolase catalytic domain [Clostridia bacterium]|nr:family 78 glycoside hydrolase catalytic domain [Clostridia bacterium]
MSIETSFIKATEVYNTFDNPVPAHYFRRVFESKEMVQAKLRIAVCGFYVLYFNGKNITRGFLSPYISNPNDHVYYDDYEVTLDAGENVIGVILGNGFQNNPGGYIWDFDRADFRSAPMFSLTVSVQEKNNEVTLLESSEAFKIYPSPIRSDDYRFGEYYDAGYEIDGWAEKGFCDSDWTSALPALSPKGELKMADIPPIVKECEIAPVSIMKSGSGYIYDFGQSNAGVCRLSVKGEKGQKIELRHADDVRDGDIYLRNVWFYRDCWERDVKIVHCDTYVCKGGEREVYQPSFTYHGFRYVRVDGITEEQAVPELLSYLVYHTDLKDRGGFDCSHEITAKLQELTMRSLLANFYHYPTDCPQREKNGWTADAVLSCETALLHFDPERNYREWMNNIRKAQREDGALPGIIPTAGWGFEWGNGPAWDCVLANLPYYVYLYRGETEMSRESADAFLAYLRYLRGRTDEKGLLAIGLGDWCHVGGIPPKAPLVLTDSVTSMDIANKIACMLDVIGMREESLYAKREAEQYRWAIRTHLIDFASMRAAGDCQSSQAMCLYYGVYDESEREAAFGELLKMIHDCDDHMDVGVLGGSVLFYVLTQFGHGELAFKMITREDYPSYGNWLKRGATTLWENFLPNDVSSMNHHFWGFISAWFIKCLAGIRLNPNRNNVDELEIHPTFIGQLDDASAYHIAPKGKIEVSWKRNADTITLKVEIPHGMRAIAVLDKGFCFEADGLSTKPVESGSYRITATDKHTQV